MKQYKQLPIPKDAAWDRITWKTYSPIWFIEFMTGVSNIIKWLPIIWKDRNWSSGDILEILKAKLIFQRKQLVEANRHEGVNDINRYMTISLNLIERIQEEYYDMEYMDYYKANFKFEPSLDNPGYSEFKTTIKSENFDEYFKKYPNGFKKVLKNGNKYNWAEWNKKTQAMQLAMNNQEKCTRLLFRVLNEKIRGWWD